MAALTHDTATDGAVGADPVGARVRAALGGVVRAVGRAGPRPARQRLDAGRGGDRPRRLAALVVAPFGIRRAARPLVPAARERCAPCVVYGAGGGGAATQFFYFSAVAHMEVAPALLIEFTAPAAVVVWLWLRHGERPGPGDRGRRRAGGAGSGAGAGPAVGGRPQRPVGVLWSLAAMVGCATYFLMSADEDNGLPPIALAAGGHASSGPLTLALLGLVGLLDMARRRRAGRPCAARRSRGGSPSCCSAS